MAKGLEITPTIRGKHISYLLEGAGQSVRDNSLSDTDTFTYAGICARLSDNAQEQKYLRKTITGILRSATGMADFADKLKTAGIETKVKKATGQVLYRATVLDGAWVPEDALGSEFTSEGIEYALKNGKMQITEDAEITLLDRYQKLTIQYPEVCTAAVKLSSRQILSAGKNGLVLQAHDDNGNPAKLMVNKSEVTTSPDGEITFNVGNDFSYDLVYEDETHGTIRGAKLIQQIDEENHVEPVQVILSENQIKAMSIRGVTIHLPQNGIERLFIPEKYVLRDLDAGQCTVLLYPNQQYSYDIEQEQTGKQDKESAGPDCATICRPQDFFLNMSRTKRKRKLVEWLESCQENQVNVLDEKIPLLSFAVDFVTAYEYQKARGIKIHPGLWKDMRVDIFLVKKEN